MSDRNCPMSDLGFVASVMCEVGADLKIVVEEGVNSALPIFRNTIV